MMRNLKIQIAADLRAPYKLIFCVALFIPVLNNLTLGWGMLFCDYYSMNAEALLILLRVLTVLYQIVRAAALACTIMTVGFWAGKKGFLPALKPTGAAALSGAAACAVNFGIYALMILWGKTDSVASFSEQLGGYAPAALFDLLILVLIEVIVTVFFALVASNKGRERMLAPRSPFMVTAYIIFGVYTALMMVDAVSKLIGYINNSAGKDLLSYCVMPFIVYLLCGGAMVLAGTLFRRTLYHYFYEGRGRTVAGEE